HTGFVLIELSKSNALLIEVGYHIRPLGRFRTTQDEYWVRGCRRQAEAVKTGLAVAEDLVYLIPEANVIALRMLVISIMGDEFKERVPGGHTDLIVNLDFINGRAARNPRNRDDQPHARRLD